MKGFEFSFQKSQMESHVNSSPIQWQAWIGGWTVFAGCMVSRNTMNHHPTRRRFLRDETLKESMTQHECIGFRKKNHGYQS